MVMAEEISREKGGGSGNKGLSRARANNLLSCALGKLRDYPTAAGRAAPAGAGGAADSGRVRRVREPHQTEQARSPTQAIAGATGRRLHRPFRRR